MQNVTSNIKNKPKNHYMNPLAFISIMAGLGYLLKESVENDPEIKGIDTEKIFIDFNLRHFKKSNISVLKGRITRNINKIITSDCRAFKIGKTGNPNKRYDNHCVNYHSMFLLCESRYPDVIEHLEEYFIDKYFEHPKNENKKGGSAGITKSVDGKHYLYIAVY